MRKVNRTKACRLFHPALEIMTRMVQIEDEWIEYPSICYRCEPDVFMEEWVRLEKISQEQFKKSNDEALEFYRQMTEKGNEI